VTPTPAYVERLGVPLRWWVQGTMFVATLALAVLVALPALGAWIVTLVALGLLALLFLSYGGAQVVVADGVLRAGRARIGVEHLGAAVALDAEQAYRAAGVEADARAYLLIRPYLKRAVKVEIIDPADPAPYWLIATRHPEELAQALTVPTRRP
jgi:hypothetical protein